MLSRITLLLLESILGLVDNGEMPILSRKGGMVKGPMVTPNLISFCRYKSICCGYAKVVDGLESSITMNEGYCIGDSLTYII